MYVTHAHICRPTRAPQQKSFRQHKETLREYKDMDLTTAGEGDEQVNPTASSAVAGPERKRMLNVLAQRRYRRRQRDRLQALETAQSETCGPRQTTPGNDKSLFTCFSTSGISGPLELPKAPVTEVVHETPGEPRCTGSGQHSMGETVSQRGVDLASLETSHFQFPDDHILAVPELEVINTACAFAKLLQCESILWDPNALRTFDMQDWVITSLPRTLQPTAAQRHIPHHPVLDILPWPSVRSKLICIFAQPPQLRPPKARDPMAIMHLIYDMDDGAEGVKVTGADRLDLGNWEIGQQVFQNWWWAFDHSIVATSNRLRMSRGAARLQIQAP